MTPTNNLLNKMAAGLGATTVTFSPSLSAQLSFVPIKSDFTPGPTLVLDDTDIADFDGAAFLLDTAGAITPTINPLNGNRQLVIPPPANGIQWEVTGTTNLPQTCYGYVLTSSTITIEGANLLAAVKFEEPFLLTEEGQAFEGEDNKITINPGAIY